ncbi:MAG: hypothetical protein OHK003_05610 [Anaerolineales bacterium]
MQLIEVQKFDDLIYDVGMHKGEDTDFYLKKGFRVVGFEADPDLANYCRERFKNYIATGQLTIVEGAIIDLDIERNKQKKTIAFYKNEGMSVLGKINLNWAERNEFLGSPSSGTVEVRVLDFVDEVQKYGIPHCMKIDIEGSDMVCVNVLRKFSKRPNYISIESDKTSLVKIIMEINTLCDLGYDRFAVVEQSDIPLVQTPPYPATQGTYTPEYRFELGCTGLFGSELHGWKSKRGIVLKYYIIGLSYYLLGDRGIMEAWSFKGAWVFCAIFRRTFRLFRGRRSLVGTIPCVPFFNGCW